MTTMHYHGIRPGDPDGRNGLRNPERGFRIETLIAEPPGQPAWGPAAHLRGKVPAGYSDEWWILDAQHYERHGLTLAQTYCYLDPYVDGPISEEKKLAWLETSLAALRANGLKALLRFAYERDIGSPTGPTLERIQAHMAQLKPVVQRNADVIYVLQAGFVGAWGEWHSSAHHLEADHAALAAVVAGVLNMLPNRMTQVRVPKYKRWVLEDPLFGQAVEVTPETAHTDAPCAQIGFHNDGFLAGETCGGTWPEPPHFSNPGNPEFDTMTRESPYVPVDGELFWGDQGGKVDGLRAAVRMRLHHYSSFSLAHSYSEREGKPYSIDDWMATPITRDQVAAAELPLSDGYFKDTDGRAVARTQFEYIRDHLGYRIELQSASFSAKAAPGDAVRVRVELVNRGFSTIHNARPVFVVLLDAQGRMVTAGRAEADPRRWQPFDPAGTGYAALTHTVDGTVTIPRDAVGGTLSVGLWLPDAAEALRGDGRYAIRVANRDVPWRVGPDQHFGVNVLGSVAVRAQ